MGHRINVGIAAGTDAGSLTRALRSAGAESVQGPSTELPDVLRVSLANGRDVDDFARQVRQFPGVRYVERDAWQFTQQ
jgi:cell division protein FtsX